MSLYRFPIQIGSFLQIKSKRELREKLSDKESLKSCCYNRKIPLKGIQLLQFQGKHLYAKCICVLNGLKCQWKLIYTKKLLKVSQPMKVLQIWEQSQVYYLKLQKSYFYHNHTPFSTFLPSDHPPIQYNCLWTMLSNMGFPAMKTYSYIADYGKQIQIPSNLKIHRTQIDIFRDSLQFSSWAKIAKMKYRAEVLFYPQPNECQPEIAVIFPNKAIQICDWHGQVIGIRVVNTKVVETAKTCEYYKGLIFYQFFPRWKNLVYMFGVYSQNNYIFVNEGDGWMERWRDEQKQQKGRNIKKMRIDMNIYKLVKIFIGIMGRKLKTIIIDNDNEIIETIKYIINKENIIRQNNKKLNYIIDPSLYYISQMNLNKQVCIRIIHKFMNCSSQQQYLSIYKYYHQNHIKKLQSDLSKLITSFNSNRKYFLSFMRNIPAFIGGWFNGSYIDDIRLQLQLRSITQISNLTHIFDRVGECLLEEIKSYENRVSMLENNYYELVYPFSFLKEARNNMVRFAFLMFVQETLKISDVNFVCPIYLEKNVNFIHNNFKWFNNQLVLLENYFKQNNGFGKINNSQNSNENYFGDSINFLNSISIDQIINKNKQKNDNKMKKDNSVDKQAQNKINIMLPPYLQIQDKGQLYICILQIRTQEWYGQYKKQQYICQRINPIYYRIFYKCSCGFREIKGIPCRHILKICIKYELPVYPYIESYLKFKDSRMEWKEAKHLMNGTDVPRVGKPKLSHRRSRKKCKPGQDLFEGYYCQREYNN